MGESMNSDRQSLRRDLQRIGIEAGATLIVHASLKSVGRVTGGPAALVSALLDAVEPEGHLLSYASWDRSPYEETLNGRRLGSEERRSWPAFDPATSASYPGFGALNEFLRRHPGALRSANPDASFVAIGPSAHMLVDPHQPGSAYGPGSPLERFLRLDGKVLLLGAPLSTVTLLHYAEAVADIPGKRRVTYEMPVRNASGCKVWQRHEDYDSNGILDCFASPDEPDAIERIATDFVNEGHGVRGRVGQADCYLFEGRPLVDYGIRWLEARFGAEPGSSPAGIRRLSDTVARNSAFVPSGD